jgi:D-alanyl-D-alanine dipeptidase
MNKSSVYQLLESQMVKYQNLKTIKVNECNEPLTPLFNINNIYQQEFNDMENFLGKRVWLRKTVVEKLILAQKLLKKTKPAWSLLVTYGYRSPEIQKKYFKQVLKKLKKPGQNKNLLYEVAHNQVAVPDVAGHPTGGALDLTIINNEKQQINMGTPIYDFNTKDIYTFSPFISRKARQNRLLLRLAMLKSGFAPFNGEWWHFSFGDKEWAFYYQKPFAIYNQIAVDKVQLS